MIKYLNLLTLKILNSPRINAISGLAHSSYWYADRQRTNTELKALEEQSSSELFNSAFVRCFVMFLLSVKLKFLYRNLNFVLPFLKPWLYQQLISSLRHPPFLLVLGNPLSLLPRQRPR